MWSRSPAPAGSSISPVTRSQAGRQDRRRFPRPGGAGVREPEGGARRGRRDFDDVVKLNNYLIDIPANLGVYREVRDKYVNTSQPPASTTIGVPALARDGRAVRGRSGRDAGALAIQPKSTVPPAGHWSRYARSCAACALQRKLAHASSAADLERLAQDHELDFGVAAPGRCSRWSAAPGCAGSARISRASAKPFIRPGMTMSENTRSTRRPAAGVRAPRPRCRRARPDSRAAPAASR